jgi:hypothetical protein
MQYNAMLFQLEIARYSPRWPQSHRCATSPFSMAAAQVSKAREDAGGKPEWRQRRPK